MDVTLVEPGRKIFTGAFHIQETRAAGRNMAKGKGGCQGIVRL